MAKVECWAVIENDEERKSVMDWVRSSNFDGYSELGDKVFVTYTVNSLDPESNSKKWGLINFFEKYPEHSIYSDER